MNLKCRVCSLQRGIFHCDIEDSLEGKLIKGVCRYYYHAALEEFCPESWGHYEMHAFDGSGPILFRLFWLPYEDARRRLAHGMAELLHHVPL